jgi:ketosteroid isomerase-like protein
MPASRRAAAVCRARCCAVNSRTAPGSDAFRLQSVLVGPADVDIVSLETELRLAQLNADVQTLDRLIADELLFTGPDGRLGTKAEDIAAHLSGVVRFREHEPEELRMRAVGDVIRIVALRTRLTVEVNGTAICGTYRYTRVWAREQGGPWRVVAGHVSAVAPLHPDSPNVNLDRTDHS